MFKTICLFLYIIGISGCFFVNSSKTIDEDILNNVQRRAVMLNAEGSGLIASGFAYNKSKIITAGHFCILAEEYYVIGEATENIIFYFVNSNDEVSQRQGGQIESIDEAKDLCVVNIPLHGITPLQIENDYEKNVKMRNKIVLVGAPLGYFPYVAYGEVMLPNTIDNGHSDYSNRLLVSAPLSYGVSGGPVINSNGMVIGVVMTKLKDFDYILTAVKADTIKQFLHENGYE